MQKKMTLRRTQDEEPRVSLFLSFSFFSLSSLLPSQDHVISTMKESKAKQSKIEKKKKKRKRINQLNKEEHRNNCSQPVAPLRKAVW